MKVPTQRNQEFSVEPVPADVAAGKIIRLADHEAERWRHSPMVLRDVDRAKTKLYRVRRSPRTIPRDHTYEIGSAEPSAAEFLFDLFAEASGAEVFRFSRLGATEIMDVKLKDGRVFRVWRFYGAIYCTEVAPGTPLVVKTYEPRL